MAARGLVFALISVGYAQPGSLDITFNPGSGAIPWVTCIAVQTNGQIVISGEFTSYNGANRTRVARLFADGSLDTSFDSGVGPNREVRALSLQSDGKMLIGGEFTSINGVGWNQPARLRPDGSVDTSFDTSSAHGAGAGAVYALALQADGKVLIGGGFSSVGGTNYSRIARLNTNGTVDVTFNPGTGITNSGYPFVLALGVQSDGRVIVGGSFAAINGVFRNYLARLNTNGSVDTTFDAGLAGPAGFVGVYSVAVLPQDKIVIGGNFSSANGYSRNGIARLNADGSVDDTFNPGLGVGGFSGRVLALAVQGDGKVIIGGEFAYVNGTNRSDVARFNADGTLDLTFNPGTGADFTVYGVASQPDGKALIGGNFYHFNGTNIRGIARLNGDTSPTTDLQFMAANVYFGTYLYGTVSNTYRVEWTSELNTPSLWTPLFNVTLQTNPQFILDPNPAEGQRFYRAVTLP